jgi:hypothetical protein
MTIGGGVTDQDIQNRPAKQEKTSARRRRLTIIDEVWP